LRALKQTPAFRAGAWLQIEPQPAWAGNWTSDNFIAYAWAGEDSRHYIVAINYASNQGQCRLLLPFPEFRGKPMHLTDVMGTEVYDRDGSEMVDHGLYIDHAPWQYNVFELRAKGRFTMARQGNPGSPGRGLLRHQAGNPCRTTVSSRSPR
jgi:hypothetical protein